MRDEEAYLIPYGVDGVVQKRNAGKLPTRIR